MEVMKAIESHHTSFSGCVILHSNVVELPEEQRFTKRKRNDETVLIPGNKVFQCRCCGRKWIENINSPMIISEEVEQNICAYYPNYITCNAK